MALAYLCKALQQLDSRRCILRAFVVDHQARNHSREEATAIVKTLRLMSTRLVICVIVVDSD